MLIGVSWCLWGEVGANGRKFVVMGGSWCLYGEVCIMSENLYLVISERNCSLNSLLFGFTFRL